MKKILCFCMVLLLAAPWFAVNVTASSIGGYTTSTYTYEDERSLIKMEISGYIGEVSLSGVPSNRFNGESINNESFHVFVISEGSEMIGKITPLSHNHIIALYRPGWRPSFPMWGSSFGQFWATEYTQNQYPNKYIGEYASLGIWIGEHPIIRTRELEYLVTNESVPFATGPSQEAWIEQQDSNGKVASYITDGVGYFCEETDDWLQEPNAEVAIEAYIALIRFNTILLTPSMADKFLEAGALQANVPIAGTAGFDTFESYNLNSSTLRDLLLAARGEAATAVTPAAPAPAPVPATPAASALNLRLTIGSTAYQHNGQHRTLPVAPVIENESTLVPVRFIAEALGADVSWEAATETAVIVLDGKTLRITVGQMAAGMTTPAVNRNGNILVPLRYVGEAFGCEFEFDGATGTILIKK
jgi:hypothetical protein